MTPTRTSFTLEFGRGKTRPRCTGCFFFIRFGVKRLFHGKRILILATARLRTLFFFSFKKAFTVGLFRSRPGLTPTKSKPGCFPNPRHSLPHTILVAFLPKSTGFSVPFLLLLDATFLSVFPHNTPTPRNLIRFLLTAQCGFPDSNPSLRLEMLLHVSSSKFSVWIKRGALRRRANIHPSKYSIFWIRSAIVESV